ncbi:hypothetical protein VTN31DRAFT_7381 [Thermomyces dupontii]|uniref:uncharacterized protein n=1 Tax=Talaromyces thermophilus TaxID=28565 RepID=UPI003742D938
MVRTPLRPISPNVEPGAAGREIVLKTGQPLQTIYTTDHLHVAIIPPNHDQDGSKLSQREIVGRLSVL